MRPHTDRGALAAGVLPALAGVLLLAGLATGCAGVSSSADDAATAEHAAVAVRADGAVAAARVPAYEQLTAWAIGEVENVWGQGSVVRPVRVRLADDAAGFAALTGLDAAITTVPASVVGRGDRAFVAVHPDSWSRLTPQGRQAVLTHEVTHLAQQSVPGDGTVPPWLVEGSAELTAHHSGERSVAQVAGSALTRLTGQDPLHWPRPVAGEDPWDFYGASWLACRYLADERGSAQVVQLYRDVAAGADLTDALPSVLDLEEAEALAGWDTWLQAQRPEPASAPASGRGRA